MDEQSGQLFSTRINQLAGEAAGHNNETAHNEVTFDAPLDVDATKIWLLESDTNICFAILDNGPGIPNIWHLLGEGVGLKIKKRGKIGSKIAGELAAGTFFQADRAMYFSRCNENVGRKHEQLNVEYNKIVKLVKTPNMDMSIANNIIRQGSNKLVRKPEPDSDKFDSDNVEYVKKLFNNNELIMRYFDDKTVTGMLKVFCFMGENKARYEKIKGDTPKIISKAEFITYNTLTGFSCDKEFKYIDTDRGITRTINQESCKKNFILGRGSVIYETDEDYDEHSCIVDETFGLISEKVLSITNYCYEKEGKTYNKCSLDNYDEEFLIGLDGKATQINKVTDKNILDIISDNENFVGNIPMYLSFVSKDEAEDQTELMNEASTLESMKQAYVFSEGGRYLARDKLDNMGLQERSLPHFRFAIVNNDATQYINIRAMKSSISLKKAHPIIAKTIQDIIKPIICKLYEKDGNMIKDGIDDWDNHKNDVLSLINTGKLVPKLLPLAIPIPVPIIPKPTPNPNPVPAPGERGPAPVVYASLDTSQTVAHLKGLKNTLNLGQKYRTKNDKSKIITVLNHIERELVLDDDMMDEKIDNLIAILLEVGKKTGQPVKHAASLQDYK
jgi:hypothetical protein